MLRRKAKQILNAQLVADALGGTHRTVVGFDRLRDPAGRVGHDWPQTISNPRTNRARRCPMDRPSSYFVSSVS
jgi:hypothetical protein